ncbi:MAG TPA: dihydrofolate reductase family protein, partial [bacterium]|nr:dihydrofolate reductase family protein [bacterium]
LLGRVTYEMMASYWPTSAAAQAMPAVAEGMNRSEKIVFSRTLSRAEWQNTRVVQDHMAEEVRRMKQMPGSHMTLLGSGSILTQLAEHNLIDEYLIMLDPVALGAGTPLFQGLRRKLDLKLLATRTFPSGVVLLTYQPAAPA